MVDSDHLSSPTADGAHRPSSRPKQPRSQHNSSSNVRQRSPSNADGLSSHPDHKVPTKRARKAINCEPCRNSKLKCDRFVSSFLRLRKCLTLRHLILPSAPLPYHQESAVFVLCTPRSVLDFSSCSLSYSPWDAGSPSNSAIVQQHVASMR